MIEKKTLVKLKELNSNIYLYILIQIIYNKF